MRSCLIREHPNRCLSFSQTWRLSFFCFFLSLLPFHHPDPYTRSVAVLNVLSLLMFLALPSRSIPNIFALPLFHARYWVISGAHLSFKILLFERAENEKTERGDAFWLCTCKNFCLEVLRRVAQGEGTGRKK